MGAPERVACHRTRYEKTAVSFMGVLCLASTLLWIKDNRP